MKTTTIYLGVLTTLFSTFTFATTIERDDQNVETEVTRTNVINNSDVTTSDLKKPVLNLEDEIKFMDSIATFSVENQKVIVNTILENERIIESQEEINPSLFFDRSIEEIIKEDNQIIESNLVNEMYPLDFELIKRYENANKNADFKNRAFDKKNLKS
ncbi:MAG: hypothetical protein V4648_01195 [Bacteroidota bacterium]